MNIEVANRLINLRKSSHLSQEALAEKLGISRQAVSKWERAEASPDMDNLIQLARLYHISLDELLEIRKEDLPASDSAGDDLPGTKMSGEIGQGKNVWEETGEDKRADEKNPAGDGSGKETVKNADRDTWDGADERESEEERRTEGDKEEGQCVNVTPEGIHVKDRDGSGVHIGWEGIRVDNEKKERDPHIEKNEMYVNEEKHRKRKKFREHFPFAPIITILYLLIGFLFHAWHPAWLLFLLIPLWYNFAYPVLVTLLFLCAGFFLDAWHPAWILYLTIPVYYSLNPYFRRRKH